MKKAYVLERNHYLKIKNERKKYEKIKYSTK